MTAPPVALAPDLVAGLRRLKLARIRAIAAEVCQAAKTQRWAPDEFLRTLIEAEIAARDESNLQARVKVAGFPVRKSLDEFKVQASAVPQASFDYLAGLEWVRAKENLCLVGPAGTGKSHLLVALGYVARRIIPHARGATGEEGRSPRAERLKGADFQLAKTADFEMAIDTWHLLEVFRTPHQARA